MDVVLGVGRLVTPPPDPEFVECEKMNSLTWRELGGAETLRSSGSWASVIAGES